ncbi:hypothetical protein EVAR_97553_1 [Eumeta japonica]|uniref:RNA-directed DNA polymerase from mobile element jockey n=1 Tax=Eumeta variegata TaxID=151549 RepID=A0A4C1WNV4_EUMVA|nr:hypothetical protein EVAR_97553_1 [Eumeta japonica]
MNPQAPSLNGLPKVHKDGKPVCSSNIICASTNYKLAYGGKGRWLAFSETADTSLSGMKIAYVPYSTLSPLLYSTYKNDIPRPQTGAQLALFANNSALYLRSSNFRQITPRLQKAIDKLSRWFKTWRIEVNPEKSATIYFN